MKLKRTVWVNKGNGQKLVTIPKNCDIVEGQDVWIDSSDNKSESEIIPLQKK